MAGSGGDFILKAPQSYARSEGYARSRNMMNTFTLVFKRKSNYR